MPNYIMMIGLPGSGKSTVAKSLFHFDAYLSTDDLVERHAHFSGGTYDSCWASYIGEATRIFEESLKEALASAHDIVHDQTNLTAKRRAGILRRIPKAYTKIAVVVSTDYATRTERLANRPGKTIPDHVLISMDNSYTLPTLSEGFDEIYTILN